MAAANHAGSLVFCEKYYYICEFICNFMGKNSWIWKNLLLAAGLVLLIFLVVNLSLKLFTQHNQSVSVPDFVGMGREQALQKAQESKLELVISDSVFVNRFKRGAVYAQHPQAGSQVKKGRKIYITLNANRKRQVEMPQLVGFSMRQAKVILQEKNLKLGRLIYKADIATNNVLGQQCGGQDIAPGTKLDVGSTVDLVLGLNPEDGKTAIPSFIGKSWLKAVSYAQDCYLNASSLVFDSTVRSYSDSISAFVYRQLPESGEERVTMGSPVRLYFTLDPGKLPLPEENTEDNEQ